jgi:hypothetical protein
MTHETGNMWSAHPANGGGADLFCITTNSFIRNDGSLVMGAGIARQARDKMPGLAQNAGDKIKEACRHLGEYGTLLPDTSSCLALFQVKTHWKNKADTQLIAQSAADLSSHLQDYGPDYEVHVNYPGIGNGGLDRGDVAPIVTAWPSNVHVWTYR